MKQVVCHDLSIISSVFSLVQTLGRSDAIKIPTRRFTTALSKMAGEGFGSSRGRSSSKTGSVGSAEGGSSSDASSQTKPQPSLYFPSVMVGAGIITSLVPAPAPQSQSSFRSSEGLFGPAVPPQATSVSQLKGKVKPEHLPPTPIQSSAPTPPPPPPHPSSLVCDRCKRRSHRRTGGGHQKTPSSISSEEIPSVTNASLNGVFAADEDTEQQQQQMASTSSSPPPVHRERIPPSLPEFYALCKSLACSSPITMKSIAQLNSDVEKF